MPVLFSVQPSGNRWLSVLWRGRKMFNRKKVLLVIMSLALLALIPVLIAGADPEIQYMGNISGDTPLADDKGVYTDAGASVPEPVMGLYTVRPGDNLSLIAGRFGVDMHELALLNQLGSSDYIIEGQLLKIPCEVVAYRVKAGETLWSISEKYRVPLRQLARVNNLSDENFVAAGQELIIPAFARTDSYTRIARSGVSGEKMAWPVVGWISSPFGIRDGKPHEGIDIAADQGAPIVAAKPGRVVCAEPMGTYGLAVIIDHGNGMRTLYAHASVLLVKPGDWVEEGQTVALVGSTGRSTGPHLHLEIRIDGQPVDPLLFLESMYA